MSASTRNRRASVYPYASSNDGGYPTSGYGAARGTFWARKSPVVGDETTTQGQAEHRQRCVFEFDYGITVQEDDLIVCDGQWKVASVTPRVSRREKIVHAYRTDDTPDRSAV